MNQPRRHHYVPKLYLKNFTLKREELDRLWVFDQEAVRQWPATPQGAAHSRDFYQIEDDQDPMAVEKWFSGFESEAAPVLNDIINSCRLPPVASKEFGYFVTFLALQIGRVPHIRETLEKFFDDVKKKQDFAARVAGCDPGPFPDFDQTWHVETIMENAEVLRPLLWMRQWSLWTVANETPDLICSDNPVGLTWTIPDTGPWPPGFGLRNTQVTFPLTRRIMIVGSFEGQPDGLTMNDKDVAIANSCTGRQAGRLFSAEEDFVWEMRDGRIGRKADLIAALTKPPT